MRILLLILISSTALAQVPKLKPGERPWKFVNGEMIVYIDGYGWSDDLKRPQSKVGILPIEKTKITEESIRSGHLEGVYKSAKGFYFFRIGVIKIDSIYKAIVLQTNSPGWTVGEVKSILEHFEGDLYLCSNYGANRERREGYAIIEGRVLTIDNEQFLKIR